MVNHLSCVTWRCWQITLPTPPVRLLRHTESVSLSITLMRIPPASVLRFFKIWLLASKVNVKLSKHLKFTFEGFSFLLEKFGCGCTQRGPFHLISTPPLWMMFLFLQSLRNNVALTPSEIPMDEFKNIAAPLEIPMISSETLQKSTMDEFVF